MSLIDDYVKNLPSKGAKLGYKSNIKSFFRYLEPDPNFEKQHNRYIGIPLSPKQRKFVENYFNNNRDYKKDVLNFVISLNGSPSKTIRSKLQSVKGFLEWNDVELSNKNWKEIKNKIHGSRAVTIDKIPTKEELRKILSFATLKDKALFFTLIGSGMRIGEACKITLNDIKELPKIYIRAEYTKSGNPRVVFISKEAQYSIEQWLLERENYLKVAVKRLNCAKPRIEGKRPEQIIKSIDDNRVFPYATSTARAMWNRLIRKAGFNQRDPSSGFHSIHIHCLRKYFSSHMNVGGMPNDVVEALLGHEDKLQRVYNIYSEKQLADIYHKNVNNILVFESYDTDKKLMEFNERLQEKDEQIKKMQEEMKIMQLTLQGVTNQLEIEKLKNGVK